MFYVFPLLGDKQGFKFEGVMSILHTHFIPTFWLVFRVFFPINRCSDVLFGLFFIR